ncbi:MAG: DUF2797 domain-containing protein [Bacteriovoracaceae bacterium]|nr:DUF2797 domain-containing protein [Bacteriovoracaceae bacterium]
MSVKWVEETPVHYELLLHQEKIALNDLLGKKISFEFTGAIYCMECNRQTKKSFNQGYCYPCFIKLAICDSCIMRPELCHFHLGTCREPQWGEDYCMQDHFVYLSYASGLKVGITRVSQVPTRFIDQGATYALPIFKVSSRYKSGQLEVKLKEIMSDRTDWRKMLQGEGESVDLFSKKKEIIPHAKKKLEELSAEVLSDEKIYKLQYPVLKYPLKVKSLDLEKLKKIEGTLEGIKGQYLILDTGVINIRKYGGYEILWQN